MVVVLKNGVRPNAVKVISNDALIHTTMQFISNVRHFPEVRTL